MSKDITVLVLVRNGTVEGISVEGETIIASEWLLDPATEMIVRVGLDVGRNMLFKSKAELLDVIGIAA
ncbi:hypothetical protein V7799_04795 [Rhizobium laguerreae]